MNNRNRSIDGVKQFKREERYIIIKLKDLKYASAENALRRVLQFHGVPTREGVVVEPDWPIYQQTWEAIRRLDQGLPQQIEQLEHQLAAARSRVEQYKQITKDLLQMVKGEK